MHALLSCLEVSQLHFSQAYHERFTVVEAYIQFFHVSSLVNPSKGISSMASHDFATDYLFDGTSDLSFYYSQLDYQSSKIQLESFAICMEERQRCTRSQLYCRTGKNLYHLSLAFTLESHRRNAIRAAHADDLLDIGKPLQKGSIPSNHSQHPHLIHTALSLHLQQLDWITKRKYDGKAFKLRIRCDRINDSLNHNTGSWYQTNRKMKVMGFVCSIVSEVGAKCCGITSCCIGSNPPSRASILFSRILNKIVKFMHDHQYVHWNAPGVAMKQRISIPPIYASSQSKMGDIERVCQYLSVSIPIILHQLQAEKIHALQNLVLILTGEERFIKPITTSKSLELL